MWNPTAYLAFSLFIYLKYIYDYLGHKCLVHSNTYKRRSSYIYNLSEVYGEIHFSSSLCLSLGEWRDYHS